MGWGLGWEETAFRGESGSNRVGRTGDFVEKPARTPPEELDGQDARLQGELRRARGGAPCPVGTRSFPPQVHVRLRGREGVARLVLGGVQGGEGRGATPDLWRTAHSLLGHQRKVWPETPQGLYFGLKTLHPTPPLRRASAPPPAPPSGPAASLLAEPSGEPPAG